VALALTPRSRSIAFAFAVLCLASSVVAVTVHANDGAKAGANIFESYCADCHSVKAAKHKSGPSLYGVIGRQSGSADGYVYSDAMRGANLVWTPETLDTFLTSPKDLVAKTKMRYGGLTNPQARADLLAFLAEQK